MLNIKTVKNPLVTDTTKDGFCFRSSCSQSLDTEELATEMAEYNSSFTTADNAGMLKILHTVVIKYLSKGYSIKLPFGIIKVNATGTCGNIQDSFSIGTGNNMLTYNFIPTDEAKREINAKIEYKQMNPDPTQEAKIYRLNSKLADASESNSLEFKIGSILRIRGRNLSFDFSNEKQGVFLENENGIVRITSYNRTGSNIVEAEIPDGIEPGQYDVYVVTKPGNDYYTATITSQITII